MESRQSTDSANSDGTDRHHLTINCTHLYHSLNTTWVSRLCDAVLDRMNPQLIDSGFDSLESFLHWWSTVKIQVMTKDQTLCLMTWSTCEHGFRPVHDCSKWPIVWWCPSSVMNSPNPLIICSEECLSHYFMPRITRIQIPIIRSSIGLSFPSISLPIREPNRHKKALNPRKLQNR